MQKIIISLSGVGDYFEVHSLVPVLNPYYDPERGELQKWTMEPGVAPNLVCLLQEGIHCSTSDFPSVINPKVIPIEDLIGTLPPLPPTQVVITHKGKAFINQQFILELEDKSYFDADKITLAKADFKRIYGAGILSTRVFYDGRPITQEKLIYEQLLGEEHFEYAEFSEPNIEYYFNNWDPR